MFTVPFEVSPSHCCAVDRDSTDMVGHCRLRDSGVVTVKRLCSRYSDDQNKAPPHHDSGGTLCASVSVGPEALAVRELEESIKPSFADWALLQFENRRLGHWFT